MLNNYLKVAGRNMLRYKAYTFINVLGLAIGMAACLLMLLFVQDELSYDTFHQNESRLVRISDHWTSGEISEDLATVPFPVGTTLQLENPEIIKNTVRLYRPSTWGNQTVISIGDKSFAESGVMFADSSFFQIFDFEFLHGSAEYALASPAGVVLTQETARKYFGNENAVGKRLELNNQLDLEVTGVLRNIPGNSHIQFDILSSIRAMKNWWNFSGFEQNWIWQATWTYFLLNDPGQAAALQRQLPDFVQRHFPESVKDGTILTLQPFTDIHLHSQRYLEIATNGNIIYVYIFSAIAVLILLIACINFMNLATARSASRAREVGMRKVLGAYRANLIRQFLGESLLSSLLAMLLALALIEAALPPFNALTGKSLAAQYSQNPLVITVLIGISVLVGIMAGSYPAFLLSGFRPVKVLKGRAISGRSGMETTLRRGLVVSQFVVSLVLLIAISIIYNQMHYLRAKDLGFNKDQVVFFDMFGNTFHQYAALKNDLLQHREILAVSRIGGSIPGLEDGIANAFVAEGMPPDQPKWTGIITATHDIENVFDLKFLAGRPFSVDFPTDTAEAFIINEAAVRDFGWSVEEAIGKKLERVRSDGTVSQSGKVVGVVRDFHFEPLHEELKPLVIRFGGGQFAVRLTGRDLPATMAHLQDTWSHFAPEWPLNFRFLDDDLEALYRKEHKLGQIIQAFAVLAIFVACLGLFGLASFTAEQRTKEMGVRKVLGATVGGLVVLMSREFTKLVAIAFVISCPIAYWVMNRWLANFANRVEIGWPREITGLQFLDLLANDPITGLSFFYNDIFVSQSWWVFALAGGTAMLIALLTVSTQAIKAALANPVEALRYE